MVDSPDAAMLAQCPEVVLAMEPGDMSFHAANTVHRTGPNLTAGYRRNLGLMYHSPRCAMNPALRDAAAARIAAEGGDGAKGELPMGMHLQSGEKLGGVKGRVGLTAAEKKRGNL
jgi:hypothetical protein